MRWQEVKPSELLGQVLGPSINLLYGDLGINIILVEMGVVLEFLWNLAN
jgi:hypothetical protein